MSKKVSKTPKPSKKPKDHLKGSVQKEIEEVLVQEEDIKVPEFRTITITLESYQNVVGFYPISDIKTKCSYCEKDLGESKSIPIIDDKNLPVGESFFFQVDINSKREIDQLISGPAKMTVIQNMGVFNSNLYEQLKLNEEFNTQNNIRSFESIVSIYEAFSGEKVEMKESEYDLKKSKKHKKGKVEKRKIEKKAKDKSSHGSKSSRLSKLSSTTKKDLITGDIGTELKSKGEESFVYGMCTIDFLPLFHGEIQFTETLFIEPSEIFKDEKMNTYKAHPKLIVTVSIDGGLNLGNSVVMNVTVESLYNLPSLMKYDMDYQICGMIPTENSQKQPILFTNPKFTYKNQEDPNKCWPGMQIIGSNANATKYKINTDNNAILCKLDTDIKPYLEDEKPKLQYNMLRRNLLSQDVMNEFAAHIQTYRKFVLELYMSHKSTKRTSENSQAGSLDKDVKVKSAPSLRTTTDKSGENVSSRKLKQFLHLMTILDVSTLLNPGVSRVRVASPLTTYSIEEALKYGGLVESYFVPRNKKEVKDSSSKDAMATKKLKGSKSKDELSSSKYSKSSKKSRREERRDPDLKMLLPQKPQVVEAPEPSKQVFNEDGEPCFIIVEIELSKPVNPKRDIEDLTDELCQLLKQKAQPSKLVLTSYISRDYFNEVLSEIIRDLNQKFHRFLEDNPNYKVRTYQLPSDFVKFLQKIGAYQTYLTSIIKATTLLVTKRFKNEDDNNRNGKSYENFIGEIFVFLISEMHTTLNKLVSNGLEPAFKEILSDKSYFFAKEAIQLERTALADRYFLERICNDQENPNYWFDYAVFFLELRDADRAFECVQEALQRKSNHIYSLLLFGVLLNDKGQKEEAETCFLNLMIHEPRWLEGWGVLYLFYGKYEKYEGMDMALEMAKKYTNDERKISDHFMELDDLAWTSKILPNTIFFRTAALLLKLRLYNWAELACSQEVQENYGLVNYLLAAICYYRGLYDHAFEHLEETKRHYGSDYAIASLSGHCLVAVDKNEEARTEYYHVLGSFNCPVNLHLVYLNSAQTLEKLGNGQEARKLILLACKYSPTPYTWLRAGQLYMQENDLLSAEECFSEGNLLDNRCADIWGHLALINLKLNRFNEAELCYEQTIKNKLEDAKLLREIQKEFEKYKYRGI